LLALAGLQWLIQNDYIDEREALQTGYSLTPKGYAALYLLGCILRRCAAAAQFLFGDPPHDGRGGSPAIVSYLPISPSRIVWTSRQVSGRSAVVS
jgi:hypothetical protein